MYTKKQEEKYKHAPTDIDEVKNGIGGECRVIYVSVSLSFKVVPYNLSYFTWQDVMKLL